jgi:hypothetical protein
MKEWMSSVWCHHHSGLVDGHQAIQSLQSQNSWGPHPKFEVYPTVIIKGRKQSTPGLIIKGLDNQARKILIISGNQVFHRVSPNFSDAADGSPDQTVKRIKI